MRNIMRRNAESETSPQFKAPWNLILDAADKTQPGSQIKKLPLEMMIDKIDRANNRVVDCDSEIMQHEEAYKQFCAAHEASLIEAKERLREALAQRDEAQKAFIRVCKQHAVFEGMDDIQRAIQDA